MNKIRNEKEEVIIDTTYRNTNDHKRLLQATIYRWNGQPRRNGASLVAQTVKNLPAMQENWVWSLGWEDPLEEGMARNEQILRNVQSPKTELSRNRKYKQTNNRYLNWICG